MSEKFAPIFASTDIEIYPYQVAAAQFTLRSSYLKGAILCDEGALGKTYEAMLVAVQKWYEGQKIAIIVPTPLFQQWEQVIVDKFGIEIDEKFNLMTYENFDNLEKYNLIAFDEAHNLRNDETQLYSKLKEQTANAYKLLLTATPMQNSIMDLYSLISFIDDSVLGDKDVFYKRYFRKPENYPELTGKISKYCFRATRKQVANYTKIPNRVPITIEYSYTEQEQALYDALMEYLPNATSKMDNYEYTLMLTRAFSSSISSFQNIALKHKEMSHLMTSIDKQAKPTALLKSLKTALTEIRKKGANKKALIFTESKLTQKYLYELLKNTYKTVVYKDYSSIEKFKSGAEILIATDIVADGFNLEFCSLVVNYDLPYNTLEIEQRINRCHRQGQENDVVVLSFLNRGNFADVRTLELINKRMLQFGGIIGNSDQVIGNFGADIAEIIQMQTRTKQEIQERFAQILDENKQENTELVEHYENVLFTSFTKEIASEVQITPKYIAEIKAEFEDDLWALIKWFFKKRHFNINEETRTISCFGHPPKVFTGVALGRNEYSMNPKYQPRSGRITLSSPIARNVIAEIGWRGIPQSGILRVENEINAQIGYYSLTTGNEWCGKKDYQLIGQMADGKALTHKECVEILSMTHECSYSGEYINSRTANREQREHRFDKMLELPDSAPHDEIRREYSKIDNRILELRAKLKQAELALDNDVTRFELLKLKREVVKIKAELKEMEQKQWRDKMEIRQRLEQKPNVKIWREFLLDIKPIEQKVEVMA